MESKYFAAACAPAFRQAGSIGDPQLPCSRMFPILGKNPRRRRYRAPRKL